MKKLFFIFISILAVDANSADKDYSFSYIDLGINYNEDIAYQGE